MDPALVIVLLLFLFIFLLFCSFKLYYVLYHVRTVTVSNNNASPPRRRRFQKGLKNEDIQKLPLVEYKAKENSPPIECPVCLGEYVDKELLKQIPGCGHSFHVNCIDEWLHTRTTCPLCRTSLIPEQGLTEKALERLRSISVRLSNPGNSPSVHGLESSSSQIDPNSVQLSTEAGGHLRAASDGNLQVISSRPGQAESEIRDESQHSDSILAFVFGLSRSGRTSASGIPIGRRRSSMASQDQVAMNEIMSDIEGPSPPVDRTSASVEAVQSPAGDKAKPGEISGHTEVNVGSAELSAKKKAHLRTASDGIRQVPFVGAESSIVSPVNRSHWRTASSGSRQVSSGGAEMSPMNGGYWRTASGGSRHASPGGALSSAKNVGQGRTASGGSHQIYSGGIEMSPKNGGHGRTVSGGSRQVSSRLPDVAESEDTIDSKQRSDGILTYVLGLSSSSHATTGWRQPSLDSQDQAAVNAKGPSFEGPSTSNDVISTPVGITQSSAGNEAKLCSAKTKDVSDEHVKIDIDGAKELVSTLPTASESSDLGVGQGVPGKAENNGDK